MNSNIEKNTKPYSFRVIIQIFYLFVLFSLMRYSTANVRETKKKKQLIDKRFRKTQKPLKSIEPITGTHI